jgi:hypothetical protein
MFFTVIYVARLIVKQDRCMTQLLRVVYLVLRFNRCKILYYVAAPQSRL